MRIAAFTICVTTLLALAQTPKEPVSLASPDGKLTITFETAEADESAKGARQLVYSASYQGKPLMTASALRLDLQGEPPLGANVRIAGVTKSAGTEAYRLVAGRRRDVSDRYEALRLDLEELAGSRRRFSIEARAFDDAVAFRYVVPEQPALQEFNLRREHTEYNIAQDATTYALVLPHYRSMYESEYLKLPVTAFANQGGVESEVLIGLPLLMKLPGVAWMAIAEADVRDYAGMYLVNPTGSWTGHEFESRFPPRPDQPEMMVSGTLPHRSPWRVLLVGAEPGRLIESTVLTSLNPPSVVENTSWIRPGKAAWDWWSGSLGPDGKQAFTTATMKHYVDFAASAGLEYMLVDAGWSARKDITTMNGRVDIPALVQYAAPKGVKIWIWCHWSDVGRQMEEAFPLYQQWGVAGVKIDFMSRDDQQMIDFYHRVASTAARHRLMVDFHGSTKPTGLERTYPNILGYEAVLGMEQSKAGRRDNPDHHVTLPFTRMLGGLMDYTPGGFDNVTEADFVPRMRDPMVTGTRAHHLAMYIVYDSPFQMVSDHPSAYEGERSFELIKAVPATWDETRVLHGEPGEYVTIARRSGDDWYLGTMTGWTPRTLRIPLTFLGSGSYDADIHADASDAGRFPKKVAIKTRKVDRTMELEARLAPGGGYAVLLRAAEGGRSR
ncbi:MAG: glycoside hydrolase family 97 protein [Vicinamibacteraceae bacterium]